MLKKFRWATNLNYAAGAFAWSSTPTQTEPSAQLKAEGFTPEKPVPANILNWLIGQVGEGLSTLDDVVSIPDFTSQPFAGEVLFDVLYNPTNGVTYLCGYHVGTSLNTLRRSLDDGASWAVDSSANGLYGTPFVDAAYDNAGKVAISTSRGSVYSETYVLGDGAGSHSPAFSSVGGGAPSTDVLVTKISYDPISGLWLWIGSDGGVLYVRTSPDAVTWTSRTITGAGVYQGFDIVTDRTSGKTVVAQTNNTGNTTKIFASNDGGITWTNTHTLTHAGATTSLQSFDRNPDNGEIILSALISATQCEFWSSLDNGVSWTKRSTLTVPSGDGGGGMAANGETWISKKGFRCVISSDKGVTWSYLPVQKATTGDNLTLRRTGGRIYLLGGSLIVDGSVKRSQYLGSSLVTA